MSIWANHCDELQHRNVENILTQYVAIEERLRGEYENEIRKLAGQRDRDVERSKADRERWSLFGTSPLAQHVCLFRVAHNNLSQLTADDDRISTPRDKNEILLPRRFHEVLRPHVTEYLELSYARLGSLLGQEIIADSNLDMFATDLLSRCFDDLCVDPHIHILRCKLVYNYIVHTCAHKLDGAELLLPGAVWHWVRASVPLSRNPASPMGFIPTDEHDNIAIPFPPQTMPQLVANIQGIRTILLQCQTADRAKVAELSQHVERQSTRLLRTYNIPDTKCRALIETTARARDIGSSIVPVMKILNIGVHLINKS